MTSTELLAAAKRSLASKVVSTSLDARRRSRSRCGFRRTSALAVLYYCALLCARLRASSFGPANRSAREPSNISIQHSLRLCTKPRNSGNHRHARARSATNKSLPSARPILPSSQRQRPQPAAPKHPELTQARFERIHATGRQADRQAGRASSPRTQSVH